MKRRDFFRATGALLTTAALRPLVASQARTPMPDVLVVLPGIMGSILQKDGKDIWALSGPALLRAVARSSLEMLSLQGDSPDVADIGDGVIATRLFPDTHVLPGFWKIDGYSAMTNALKGHFMLEPGRNYFEFPYDWRRDIRAAARRLASESRDHLAAWRRHSGNADAKLMLVGHSLGGLVGRYYCECLEGWRDCRRLITIGTPFRGSLNALNTLSNGMRLGPATLDQMTELARSFTSTYQLLPRYPCYDAGNGDLVRVGESAGIPHVDRTRAAAALALHREIDACVTRNAASENYHRGYRVHPIVGGYQRTMQTARLSGGKLTMDFAYPQGRWDGDGTVPEVSAVPVELSDSGTAHFVSQVHGSLQNTPAVLDHLLKVLSARDIGALKIEPLGQSTVRVRLSVDDGYREQDPIVVRAGCSEPEAALRLLVVDATSGQTVFSNVLSPTRDDSREVTLGPLPVGTYRATVSGPALATAVTDVFVVAAL